MVIRSSFPGSLLVYFRFITISFSVHYLFTSGSLPVYFRFIACSLPVYYRFTAGQLPDGSPA
jgi:hypothetical protein